MAKIDPNTTGQEAAPNTGNQPVVAQLTLTDFCIRLSETVRRPELIGAFEFHERVNGRLKASAEEFQTRFVEFTTKPA